MGTIFTERRIVVVPVDALDTARLLSRAVDKDVRGESAFSVSLSASGKEPATHAWFDWRMTVEERKQMDVLLALVKGAKVIDGEKRDADSVLEEMGLARISITITLAKDADPKAGDEKQADGAEASVLGVK